ncbi:glycosyltransferase involved in cell wall biosynthesis [Microbacterium sp. AK009]|uniref:glycosyltransferase family 2 protein n=1 Tax=Microbacterium sp. AK009 TaxID=2723068 RepID=UPI0015CB9202|nr:glycosyltransferase family 2 protein [Microbacterium sp. AK009]NYF16581.1 glycosyltransferase involved in cell wall biosynthesis [Microbacterium sp. AK009]
MTSSPQASPRLRVSVVVAVYNPGAGFDELLASLDGQSLGADAFEVILCDDGSDEATRARLAAAARTRANVRVLTLARTGWPGTPRNHGIDAAEGEYVFFADQDDRFPPEALERMCDYADRHRSDVVIGRVLGIGRDIPRAIFARDIPHAHLDVDPLLELLTPHKLFRVAFLRAHGIRFPDGRVRLEDHLFVVAAYFAASVISVLASSPCYYWVKHRGSASSSRIDPVIYFPHLLAVLDLVEANTDPGEVRDRLLRHWYRGKILQRLEGRRVVRYPPEYLAGFLDVVTPIARDRFGPGVEAGLALPFRVRSALLRGGRRDDLIRFCAWEGAVTCRAEVVEIRSTRSGRLRMTLRATVERDGTDAFLFDSPAGPEHHRYLRLPEDIAPDLLPGPVLDATHDLRRDRVEVGIRGAGTGIDLRRATRPTAPGAVTVVLDPVEIFGAHEPAERVALRAHVRRAGWAFTVPLRVAARPPGDLLRGAGCVVEVGPAGDLVLRRDRTPGGWLRQQARLPRAARTLPHRLLPRWARRVGRRLLSRAPKR